MEPEIAIPIPKAKGRERRKGRIRRKEQRRLISERMAEEKVTVEREVNGARSARPTNTPMTDAGYYTPNKDPRKERVRERELPKEEEPPAAEDMPGMQLGQSVTFVGRPIM